jgi:hypothetical protein
MEKTKLEKVMMCFKKPLPEIAKKKAPAKKQFSNHKTINCLFFEKGICKNGQNCNYAHGQEDLKQNPVFHKKKPENGDNQILRHQLEFLSKKLAELYSENQNVLYQIQIANQFLNKGEIDLAADNLHVY